MLIKVEDTTVLVPIKEYEELQDIKDNHERSIIELRNEYNDYLEKCIDRIVDNPDIKLVVIKKEGSTFSYINTEYSKKSLDPKDSLDIIITDSEKIESFKTVLFRDLKLRPKIYGTR